MAEKISFVSISYSDCHTAEDALFILKTLAKDDEVPGRMVGQMTATQPKSVESDGEDDPEEKLER